MMDGLDVVAAAARHWDALSALFATSRGVRGCWCTSRWLPGGADAVVAATEIFLQNGFSRVGPGARMPEMRRILA